jgi:hypothetical protein
MEKSILSSPRKTLHFNGFAPFFAKISFISEIVSTFMPLIDTIKSPARSPASLAGERLPFSVMTSQKPKTCAPPVDKVKPAGIPAIYTSAVSAYAVDADGAAATVAAAKNAPNKKTPNLRIKFLPFQAFCVN